VIVGAAVRGGVPDRDPATGRGAIVYDRPARFATFIYADAGVREFNLRQTAQAQRGPTATPPAAQPRRCKAPRLKGKTLRAAKRALRRAHCRAGKVTRRRSRKVRRAA
jgi:hypothetical protein